MAPRDYSGETMTESMVDYPAVDIVYPTKRKADSDPPEEFEESDGDEEEEYVNPNDEAIEESDGDEKEYVNPNDEFLHATWWTTPEWDVDSYDGREYHSSQEEDEFSDKEDDRLWRRLKRQLIETKGFYVEPELRPWAEFSEFKTVRDMEMSAGFGQTYREYFAEMACLCVQKYNQEKGFNVEFVEVVRGYYTKGSRSKSYITFMAREEPEGPLIEYQAKVWCTFVQNENYPILCRPAPTKKPSNQNY